MLYHEPDDAAWNMAIDEALLELAEPPTLRIYSWKPHAVSLGYFQSIEDFADLPLDTPIVRRATGGGAIHHGDEVTFSLALPASYLPQDIAGSYVLLHDAIVRALSAIGVMSQRAQNVSQPTARPTDRWCFRLPVRDDLVTDAGKLLGSAQRRTHVGTERVLHHGSLVLNRPSHTPFVAAVADQVDVTDQLRSNLRDGLVAELTNALGLIATPGNLTDAEHALAAQLRTERFSNPSHIKMR